VVAIHVVQSVVTGVTDLAVAESVVLPLTFNVDNAVNAPANLVAPLTLRVEAAVVAPINLVVPTEHRHVDAERTGEDTLVEPNIMGEQILVEANIIGEHTHDVPIVIGAIEHVLPVNIGDCTFVDAQINGECIQTPPQTLEPVTAPIAIRLAVVFNVPVMVSPLILTLFTCKFAVEALNIVVAPVNSP